MIDLVVCLRRLNVNQDTRMLVVVVCRLTDKPEAEGGVVYIPLEVDLQSIVAIALQQIKTMSLPSMAKTRIKRKRLPQTKREPEAKKDKVYSYKFMLGLIWQNSGGSRTVAKGAGIAEQRRATAYKKLVSTRTIMPFRRPNKTSPISKPENAYLRESLMLNEREIRQTLQIPARKESILVHSLFDRAAACPRKKKSFQRDIERHRSTRPLENEGTELALVPMRSHGGNWRSI